MDIYSDFWKSDDPCVASCSSADGVTWQNVTVQVAVPLQLLQVKVLMLQQCHPAAALFFLEAPLKVTAINEKHVFPSRSPHVRSTS